MHINEVLWGVFGFNHNYCDPVPCAPFSQFTTLSVCVESGVLKQRIDTYTEISCKQASHTLVCANFKINLLKKLWDLCGRWIVCTDDMMVFLLHSLAVRLTICVSNMRALHVKPRLKHICWERQFESLIKTMLS